MRIWDVKRKILKYLHRERGAKFGDLFVHSTHEIVEALEYKPSAYSWIHFCLGVLEHEGKVEKIRHGRRLYWILSQNRSEAKHG